MSTIEYKKPPQFELDASDFQAGTFAQNYQIDVMMFHDTSTTHGQPRFLFKAVYKSGGAIVTSKIQTFICGIPGDAKVDIRIDPAIANWCKWSDIFLPVTAKSSEPDIGASTHGHGVASFKVKKRAEADLRYHHLYLNIQLLVGTTTAGNQVWHDYNYDPDVINPRPPGRIAGDEAIESDHPYVQDTKDDIIVPPPPPQFQLKPQVEVVFA